MSNRTGFSNDELNHLSILSLLEEDDIDHLSDEAASEILKAINVPAPSDALARSIIERAERAEGDGECDEEDARHVSPTPIFPSDLDESETTAKFQSYPYVARRQCEEQFWEAIDRSLEQDSRPVLLTGPRGSGKSTLWRARLANSAQFRERFDLSLTIDCFSLQSRSAREVQLDALFGLSRSDHAYHSILEETKKLEAFAHGCKSIKAWGGSVHDILAEPCLDSELLTDAGPLGIFILAKFGFFNLTRPKLKGIVVFDHVDRLARQPEVILYFRKLCTTLEEVGLQVVIIGKLSNRADLSPLRAKCININVGLLSDGEVREYWSGSQCQQVRESGISVDQAAALVGGSPRLLRDLCRFVNGPARSANGNPFRAFHTAAARSIMPEIARLDETLSKTKCREKSFAALRGARPGESFALQSKSGDRLRESGAIVSEQTATYRFAARSIQFASDRYLSKEGRLWISSHPSEEEIIEQFTTFSIIPPRFTLGLMQEIHHNKVFGSISRILRGLGLTKTNIWLRDPANAKLWLCAYSDSRDKPYRPSDPKFWAESPQYWVPQPLYSEQEPVIAMALKSGRIVSVESGATVLPVTGESGRISVLMLGHVDPAMAGPLEMRQQRRTLWHFVRAIQPAIAVAAERVHARRADRTRRSNSYRALSKVGHSEGAKTPADTNEIFQNLLQQAGCNVVAVLERGASGWVVRLSKGLKDELVQQPEMNWLWRFEPSSHRSLDEIYDHHSGRPIVKTGTDLLNIFPGLWDFQQVSAFICPCLEAAGGVERLIVFGATVTSKEQQSDRSGQSPKAIAMEGRMQQNLFRLASLANAALT